MPLQDSAASHGGDPPPHPPPPSPPKPETKVLSLLLKVAIMILLTTLFFVFLGLATALLLIHLCVASALHRRRRRHRHRRGAQSPNSSSGFSPRDLKKLLQFRFSSWVNSQSQIDCPICLDGFCKGQWCRRLGGCGHVYHRKCIDSWLIRVPACPLCRSCVRLDSDEHQLDCVSSQNYEILYAL